MPRLDGSSATKKGPRKRRIFSRPRPTPSAVNNRGGGQQGSSASDGCWHGAAKWILSMLRVGGERQESLGIGAATGTASRGLLIAIIGFIVISALSVAVFVGRHRRRLTPAQAEQSQKVTDQGQQCRREQQQPATDNTAEERKPAANTSSVNCGPPRRSEHRRYATESSPQGGGERRISLYDVLTGDAPIPLREATSGGVRSGFDPGGSRRASIFDRIADVVFNEEYKDDDPVDAVAIRERLSDEFRVTFREGAMGMTLSMEPGSRNAIVGKLTPNGQAHRAGVQTHDLVIGVGEHKASSYGTVLAFMNIMGRPIDLQFRKFSVNTGARAGGGGDVRTITTLGGEDGPSGIFVADKRSEENLGASRHDIPARLLAEASSPRKPKAPLAPTVPSSPISPRKPNRIAALGQEVASSDSPFSYKMEHGVVVTKYGKKGAAAQRVLFLDGLSMSVAWRDLDSRSPGHRRSKSFTNLVKGQREALALAHLVEVVAGDEVDPDRPSEKGSALLREHCDETLLERSFALQFKERSLEMTCDSQAEMRQLVTGFRDLQRHYGS